MATKAAKVAEPTRGKHTGERIAAKKSDSARTAPNGQSVSEDAIRLCAYLKWEAAGRPAGDGCCFWVEAERELRQEKQSVSGHA